MIDDYKVELVIGNQDSFEVESVEDVDATQIELLSGYIGPKGDKGDKGDLGNPEVALMFIINGGGDVIDTGTVGDLYVPYDCQILEWAIVSDDNGSIQIDIWKSTFDAAPPTSGGSIVGLVNPPRINNSNKARSTNLTGWTTTIEAGSVLRFNVDSVTNIRRCNVSLRVIRTN